MIKKYGKWLLPLLIVAIIAPFSAQIDLAIARYFYYLSPETASFVDHSFFEFMYNYGVIPGQLIAVFAVFFLFLSYVSPFWKKWRSEALLIILTLAVGAGFIVHTIFKDHWGRPRPKQVIEFGGQQEFRPFYKPNIMEQPEPSKSFPCGHCTMGFIFFTVGLIGLRKQNKTLIICGMGTAALLGITLGITRMAQGGHFFSDILISAVIMWLTALTSEWLIYERKETRI